MFLAFTNKLILVSLLLLLIPHPACYSETPADPSAPAVNAIYLSDIPNPNEFTLFANGGWDGGWFVGYHKCWTQEILVPEITGITKAFIGAKLGRMKTQYTKSDKGRGIPQWDSSAVPAAFISPLHQQDHSKIRNPSC